MSVDDYLIEQAIKIRHSEAALIEQACEAALQTGTMGVLVRNVGMRVVNGGVVSAVTAHPSPDVPYGVVRYEETAG